MKKTSQISARISDLAKSLLELEQKRTKESEAAIIERCLIQGVRTPEAIQLIREYASKEGTISAIMSALKVHPNKGQNK